MLGWLGAKGNEKEVIGNMDWAAVSWLMRLQSCRLLSQGMQCQAQPVLAKKPDNIPFEGRKPIWGGKTLPITDRTCTSEKLC